MANDLLQQAQRAEAAVPLPDVAALVEDLEDVPCKTEADRFASMVHEKVLDLIDKHDHSLFGNEFDIAGFVIKRCKLKLCVCVCVCVLGLGLVFFLSSDHD